MYKHNFANCTATWAGIDIKNSTDPGMSIDVSRAEPRYTFKTNGVGKLIRTRSQNDSGTLTCTLDWSSPAHTLLMVQIELETVDLFTIYDGDTKRKWYFINATLVTDPNFQVGGETTPFSWAWQFEKMDYDPVTNININANIIGS